MAPIEFEYWSDPLCIWAFVGQPKLDHVLEHHGDHLSPRYYVVPVFGSLPQRFREGLWARTGPEGRAEATAKIAREHGRADVSGECWLTDCPASSWSPGAAIKAVFAMEEAGQLAEGTGADYQRALRARFFVESRNVARREEQLALAEAMGIPREGVELRLDDGSALAALWELAAAV